MKKQKEEKAKAPKESSTVFGCLRAGTAIAEMRQLLDDQKKHSLKDLQKVCDKHKVNLTGRLYQLGVYGKHPDATNGGWGLTTDEDTVQLTVGKAAAQAKKAKPEKKEAAKAPKESDSKDVSSRALKMVAQQLRRTLKSGKTWTKNKIIQALVKDGVDQKTVEAALKSEIKAGGITKDDGGELTLA